MTRRVPFASVGLSSSRAMSPLGSWDPPEGHSSIDYRLQPRLRMGSLDRRPTTAELINRLRAREDRRKLSKERKKKPTTSVRLKGPPICPRTMSAWRRISIYPAHQARVWYPYTHIFIILAVQYDVKTEVGCKQMVQAAASTLPLLIVTQPPLKIASVGIIRYTAAYLGTK